MAHKEIWTSFSTESKKHNTTPDDLLVVFEDDLQSILTSAEMAGVLHRELEKLHDDGIDFLYIGWGEAAAGGEAADQSVQARRR